MYIDRNNLVLSHAQRINTIIVLELEVEVLKRKLKACIFMTTRNHHHTSIGVLNSRIDELNKEIMKD